MKSLFLNALLLTLLFFTNNSLAQETLRNFTILAHNKTLQANNVAPNISEQISQIERQTA